LYFPHHKVNVFGMVSMPVAAVVVLFVGLTVAGALSATRATVGCIVPLGGALFGSLYYQLGITITGFFERSSRADSRPRARPALRVVPAEPEDTPTPVGAAVESQPRPKEAVDEQLEARVDQVLAKVSQFGQESLTPEEREILFKASELYKKRRK
jgi:hypothetical protein